jgi:hypothetical protein
MPKKGMLSLRPVTINGAKLWQVTVPLAGGGRKQRTFKLKVMAQQFFEIAKVELEKRRASEIADEARRAVHSEPLSRPRPNRGIHGQLTRQWLRKVADEAYRRYDAHPGRAGTGRVKQIIAEVIDEWLAE